MKYPPSCGCTPPRPPGVLLPKIVACQKRVIPHLCTELEIFGLSGCCAALRLSRILPSAEPPSWTITGNGDCGGRLPVCISIPLRLLLCDPCGRTHTASSVIDVETWLPRSFAESWGCKTLILPTVHLICSDGCACGTRFSVQLHVSADIYLLAPETCPVKPPACPNLPLYPPPVCR